jgi:protein-S-isoprenylcysteine O-methyltransferase Ste14
MEGPMGENEGAAMDHADVVALPPVIYGVALVAGVVVKLALGGSIAVDSWLRLGVGIVALVLGAIGSLRFARIFQAAGQDKDPRTPTPALVTDGIYARSRNPAYVSLTLLQVGLACVLDNVWILVFLFPVLVLIHFGVILREEAYLERKFGDEYRSYKARVRRWI